jgi:small-conductance mechanosensitive channel
MDTLRQLRSSLPSMEQVGNNLATLLPRILVAAGRLLVGWLVAKLLRAATRAMLARLGRAVARRAPGHPSFLEGEGATILARAVFWVVLFISAMFATEAVGLPVVSSWLAGVTAFLPRILVALAVIVASVVAARMVQSFANRASKSLGGPDAERIGRLARVALLVLGFLVALQQLGINVSFVTTAFFIVLGGAVAGAALGFALGCHKLVSNILAMHYVRRGFRAGDGLRIGETRGKILRTTPVGIVVETDDGEANVPGFELMSQVTHRYQFGGGDK